MMCLANGARHSGWVGGVMEGGHGVERGATRGVVGQASARGSNAVGVDGPAKLGGLELEARRLSAGALVAMPRGFQRGNAGVGEAINDSRVGFGRWAQRKRWVRGVGPRLRGPWPTTGATGSWWTLERQAQQGHPRMVA